MSPQAKLRFVLLLVAGGMLLTAFEVKMLHFSILARHPQGWIPIYYCFGAVVMALIGLAQNRLLQWLAAVYLALAVPVGLIGLWNHSEGEMSAVLSPITGVQSQEQERGDEDGEEREEARRGRPRSEGPPPWAPLGIAGLGLIGAIVAFPARTPTKEPADS